MKYLAVASLLLAGNEIVSIAVLTVIAWMLIADVAREAGNR